MIKYTITNYKHPDTVILCRKIAIMYDKKGDYSKSIEFYTKYLNLETDQIDIASAYNNIGTINARKGDLDKGLENFTKSLEIRKKNLSSNHLDIAWS